MAISPDGNTAYVANAGTSDSVSVLDTATNTVTDNILVGIGNTPYAVAVSPGGSHVYVAIGDTNTVSVIDTATNTVTDNILVGTGPVSLALSPDGTIAYVPNYYGNTVSVLASS